MREELEIAIEALSKSVDVLIDDLGPVLLPENPSTSGADVEGDRKPRSIVCNALDDACRRLKSVLLKLEDTRGRLDIP